MLIHSIHFKVSSNHDKILKIVTTRSVPGIRLECETFVAFVLQTASTMENKSYDLFIKTVKYD